MSRALYMPSRPSFARAPRGRADLSAPGLVIAAVIFALFAFDVAHAAPARVAAVENVASALAYDVVVSVDADVAPTFQVFRGSAPRTWVVELPGVDLTGTQVAHRGPDLLLASAVVEPAGRGSAGRIVLTFFADDVDFEAATKKKTLQITFHHQGDKLERASLLTAHTQRAVERDRIAAAALAPAPEAEAARRRQLELDRLAAVAAEQEKARVAVAAEREREQERARVAAVQKANEDAARAAAQKKLDDDDKARLALIEQQKLEQQTLEQQKLEQQKLEQRHRDEAAALLKKKQAEDDERARVAALAKKKAEEDLARVAAQKKLDEEKALAALKKKKADEELARVAAQKKLDDERAAEQQRIAAAKKKQAEEELARVAAQKKLDEEKARLAAIEADKQRAIDAERQRLAATAAQKKLDDDKAEKQRAEQERARLAGLERQRQEALAKEQQRIAALAEQQRRDDERAEQARVAAIAAQKKLDDERAAALADKERARLAVVPTDDAGFGGRGTTATPAPAIVAVKPPAATTTTKPRVEAFGGIETGRTIELSRGGNRYERVALPKEGGGDDDWGDDDDDDDDNDIDEGEGRSVLSQVTVQRMGNGARVGVRVDGGARYNVARRGRDRLVLTLVDTRAENLDVRRVLDARGLGSAVVRVLPTVEEGSRFRIELVVETRGQVPVRVEQDGQMLWLEVQG